MSRFTISTTPLDGLKIIERKQLGDTRGFLSRLFCAEEFVAIGWNTPIAQINHTTTVRRGTMRGMHFQYPPHSEIKLVSCLRGEIWDVAIDIRADSPTFMQHHGVHLSAANNMAMMLPQGFAHGFQTLTDNVELLYLHSATYHKESEGGLSPEDAKLNIKWPLPITDISDKDVSYPQLENDFKGVIL